MQLNKKMKKIAIIIFASVFVYFTQFSFGEVNLANATTTISPAACKLYAVHDGGLNNSQFITINIATKSVSALGSKYAGYDIEGLDIDPKTNIIYVASDKNGGSHAGSLFKVDAKTGSLILVGKTGFSGIDDLSFKSDGSLWGWSEGKGLVSIDKDNGKAILVYSSSLEIEGLAWSRHGATLYATSGNKFYTYKSETNTLVQKASNLPGEVEGLEMRPDGLLIGGVHNSNAASIFTYEPDTLSIVSNDSITTKYNDIEDIAWPVSCPIVTPTPKPTPTPIPTPVPKCILNITKQVNKTSAGVGDTLTYTLKFSNSGNSDCTGGVKIKDIVDNKLTFISETHTNNVETGYGDDPVYNDSNRTLLWNANTLTPGESGSVSWKATINNPENCGSFNIPNAGSITSKEYSNLTKWVNSNTVGTSFKKVCPTPTPTPVFKPSINLTKTANPTTLPAGGGQVVYTYRVTNPGNVSLSNITLTDDKCSAVNYTGGDSNNNSLLETSETWNYQCWSNITKTVTNTAIVRGKAGNTIVSDIDKATVYVELPIVPVIVDNPAIDLIKSANPAYLASGGGYVLYTYYVSNPGNITLININLTDDKCGSINFRSGDNNSNGQLETSETWRYECGMNLYTTTTNIARANGQGGNYTVFDTAMATVYVGSTTASPSINLTKTANPTTLPAGGGQVVYTYRVTNPGNVSLSNITLTDDKCSAVNYTGGDSNNNSLLETSETWNYQCSMNLAQTTTNIGRTSGQYGGNTYYDTDTITVTLPSGSPSIKLTKEANPASLPAGGGQATYTYRIRNIGNTALNNVTLTDDKCSSISSIGGDSNSNSILDTTEVWAYQCSMNLIQTTTNFATARAYAGNIGVTDTASAIVAVGTKLPKTGAGGFLADLINSISGITGLFGAASAGLYLKYARR